jgi:hypothetical protein
MPFPFAELTMLVVICTLVCLIMFALVYGETQRARSAGIAEGMRSATRGRSTSLEHATLRGMPVAQEPFQTEPMWDHSTAIYKLCGPCEVLRRLGFTPTQIDRLLTYRAAYRTGSCQPDPLTPKRLAFARWLYQQGKISG